MIRPILKNMLAFILLLMCFQTAAQTVPNAPARKSPGKGAAVNSLVQTLPHDTCLDRTFSIVFYLIQDSTNSLTTSATTHSAYYLPDLVSFLNSLYSRICVSFVSCSTVIIPNYTYNDWEALGGSGTAVSNYYTDKTINVYFPDKVSNMPQYEFGGYCYPFPPAGSTLVPRDAVVLSRKDIMGPFGFYPGAEAIVAHHFGHFFGLPHTCDEINPGLAASPPPPAGVVTKEWVDRTNANCYLHGDGFCDTEADPWPAKGNNPRLMEQPCTYFYEVKDGKGSEYFPPVDNYMSFYTCRCRFTQEQYNHMASFILKKRNYLH